MAVEQYPKKPIARPHTKITVDTSGIGGSSSGSDKQLMLIGSAKGGKPGAVYRVRNYPEAKSIFREGDLLDAMELAWNPSPDQLGAGDILALRVDSAQEATLTKGGLKVTSKLYGREANDIQVALEENSLTQTKRLIVDFTKDHIHQVYDNLGKIFKVAYTGEQGTATLTVEKDTDTELAKKMVIKAGEDVVKEYDLTSGIYAEVNAIINDINNLPDFEASFFPFGDKNVESRYLDIQADVDLKAKEPSYITALGGDIIKQVKYDQYISVEIDRKGKLEPFESTKLTGGTDGTVPESWADKYEKLANEGGYYLVPLTDKQAIHSEAVAFATDRSDNGEPMRVICGGGYDESIEELFKRSATLQNPRALLVGFSGTRIMDDGRIMKLPSYMLASQVAGLASGLEIGASITFKNILINELSTIFKGPQLDQLNLNGVVMAEFVRNRSITSFRITDDVTTFNDRTDPVKNEMAVGEANDFLVSELKIALDNRFIGTKVIETSASLIKNFVQSFLDDKKRKQEIQGYTPEDVQVILDGDTALISLTVFPIRSLKKIDVKLIYRQQILAA